MADASRVRLRGRRAARDGPEHLALPAGTQRGGTGVTESFELPDTLLTRLYWMIAGSARGRTNLNGMHVTLEKIRAAAESADLPQ